MYSNIEEFGGKIRISWKVHPVGSSLEILHFVFFGFNFQFDCSVPR